MASKMIVTLFALAMVATAMGQDCGCSGDSGISGVNYGLGLSGNNLGLSGYNLGLSGNNLGLSGYNLGLSGNNLGLSGNNVAVSGSNGAYVGNGGGFAVTSYSPLTPSGISVLSENNIDGNLEIIGALPVLSACAFEGQLPTTGQVGVQYGCGNGNVEITSQNSGAAGYGGVASNSLSGLNNAANVNLGYGAGIGNGCGCGYTY